MRASLVAVLTLVSACTSTAMAADVTSKVTDALRVEWMDQPRFPLPPGTTNVCGALHCLRALDLLTSKAATTNLSVTNAAVDALRRGSPDTRVFFFWQAAATNLVQLLLSTSQNPAPTDSRAQEDLFAAADAEIADLFENQPDVLKRVDDQFIRINYPRAMYYLLRLESSKLVSIASAEICVQSALVSMDIFRRCYSLSPSRLLGLVHGHYK